MGLCWDGLDFEISLKSSLEKLQVLGAKVLWEGLMSSLGDLKEVTVTPCS